MVTKMDPRELRESLSSFAKRLRDAMAGTSTGPLIIAKDVMDIADRWDEYKSEAEGLSCTAWLAATCGRGRNLGWWRNRAKAVAFLGESCRRTTDHEVAVYCLNRVPKDRIGDVLMALRRAQVENNGTPITRAMAVPILRELLGPSLRRVKPECDKCKALRAQILAMNAEPVV